MTAIERTIGRIYEPTVGDPIQQARLVTAVRNQCVACGCQAISTPMICYRHLEQDANETEYVVSLEEWESWLESTKPDIITHRLLMFQWDINGYDYGGKWQEGGPDGYHIVVAANTLEEAEALVKNTWEKQYNEPVPFPFNAPTVQLAPAVVMVSYSYD